MKASIDFLNFKTIFRYAAGFAVMLVGGAFLKDIFAIMVAVLLIYYIVSRNLFRALEVWLIWFFCNGFYFGQNFIESEMVAKYLTKPSFLLLVVFAGFFKSIPSRFKTATFSVTYLVYIIFTLISSLYHDQSPFVIVTVASFFFVYLLFRSKDLTWLHCRKLLNLFMSVAVVQTFICVLQITSIITPASQAMDDGTGGQFEWVAGLDDAASGTFGPIASHIVSWYAAFTMLFCVLMWSVCRKNKYLLLALIALAQFATVDSKTVMGVTAVMIMYLINYLQKNRSYFRLNIQKLSSIIIFIVITVAILFQGIDFYYQYQNREGGAQNRSNLNDVYEKEVKESRDAIIDNIGDWGKIQGFIHIFEDHTENDPLDLLWGYGLLGYTFNGKVPYIEGKDTRIMQLNNFTRSRSGLISTFAQNGMLGCLLLLSFFVYWYRYNITRKNATELEIIINSLVKIFLPFTFLAAFVCSILVTSLTVISFGAIIGLLHKYAELNAANRYRYLQYLKETHPEYAL